MGELADQVTGDGPAEGPATLPRQPVDLGEQPLARHARVGGEELPPRLEDDRQILGDPVLHGVVAEDVGAASRSASNSSKIGPKSQNTMSSASTARSGGFSR